MNIVPVYLQLRKQVADVTEKKQSAEHEREVAEQKVLEVRVLTM